MAHPLNTYCGHYLLMAHITPVEEKHESFWKDLGLNVYQALIFNFKSINK